MTYYAHSGNESSKTDWQPLRDHLLGVAERAASVGQKLGLERAAYIAGLLHDLGKYSPEFQRRLEGANIAVEHSTAGAKVLLERARGPDRAIAELIAYCILGHHAGLPDRQNETDACYDRRLARPINIDPVWEQELPIDLSGLVPELIGRFPRNPEIAGFSCSVLVRMLFSCLVDADRRDAEAHDVSLGHIEADRNWTPLPELLDTFLARFDAHMAALAARSGALTEIRRQVLTHVRSKAKNQTGFFTLTVPTGGGKTLASLGFALDHARAHGLQRIIYAIPFTSIIDQTAEIFRNVLGDEHVLEHHSAIEEERFEYEQRRDRMKLAMEDWTAPVVVTTHVQLFESLYSARPSRARKLHNIAHSVIVLDEAQTLPRHLLQPIMRMLEELVRNYKVTVVLCTATQPALGSNKLEGGLPLADDCELAPNPRELAARLARTYIRHAGSMRNADLVESLAGETQALVIVNSRRHALDLYQEAQTAGLDGLIHLTTRQCTAHRRLILDDIRIRLKEGKPCRLIATSLIEAGVDVDFPKAWRAEAGLDQIVQAAGRVNREGKRPRDGSIVTVFAAPDYPPPVEIRDLIGDMKRIIDRHDDLLSPEALEAYFSEVYWRMGDGLDVSVVE
ncbi:CRISPR-associated helicase Cas3' [Daeguia caeni]|uniref:CRISPR-associated helicase Cas3 n=1 Tax=Daeguia caeni TaxID=439612 RepID=A0ABV9H755_9HYPH